VTGAGLSPAGADSARALAAAAGGEPGIWDVTAGPYRTIYDTHPADEAIRQAVERGRRPEPGAAQHEAGQ
jgi:hypothetical protein